MRIKLFEPDEMKRASNLISNNRKLLNRGNIHSLYRIAEEKDCVRALTEILLNVIDSDTLLSMFGIGTPVASFEASERIHEIIIPDTMENIAKDSFSCCPNLERVHFSSSVKIIDAAAFMGSALKNVQFSSPSKWYLKIGSAAFYSCDKLSSIHLPEKTINIGSNAFNLCRNLTDVYLPGSVEFVGEEAFKHVPARNLLWGDTSDKFLQAESSWHKDWKSGSHFEIVSCVDKVIPLHK